MMHKLAASAFRTTCSWILGALAVALGAGTTLGDEPQGAPVYGLRAMEHPELLPLFLPNGTQTKQFISYDVNAKNGGSFHNFCRYEENGEYVFFDEIGPGCLYRQQMNVFSRRYAGSPTSEARLRMYFDDEPKPRIDMTFDEFFGKRRQIHARRSRRRWHISTSKGSQWDEGPGAYAISYYPFPFAEAAEDHRLGGRRDMKRFDATWFQYTYLKYPAGHGRSRPGRARRPTAPWSAGSGRPDGRRTPSRRRLDAKSIVQTPRFAAGDKASAAGLARQRAAWRACA